MESFSCRPSLSAGKGVRQDLSQSVLFRYAWGDEPTLHKHAGDRQVLPGQTPEFPIALSTLPFLQGHHLDLHHTLAELGGYLPGGLDGEESGHAVSALRDHLHGQCQRLSPPRCSVHSSHQAPAGIRRTCSSSTPNASSRKATSAQCSCHSISTRVTSGESSSTRRTAGPQVTQPLNLKRTASGRVNTRTLPTPRIP